MLCVANLLGQDFPRTAFFRNEIYLAGSNVDYAYLAQFDAVISKFYAEEVQKSRTDAAYQTILEFKNRYPDKIVLNHFNLKEVRRPGEIWRNRGETDFVDPSPIFPGHYLYYTGSTLQQNISAATTTFPVLDVHQFKLNDDVRIVEGNDLDDANAWNTSEVVYITAINEAAGTITVERGKYETTARAFSSGATLLPQAKRYLLWANKPYVFWIYNLTRYSKSDTNGMNCPMWLSKWLADKADSLNTAAGKQIIDGYEFDVTSHLLYVPNFIESTLQKYGYRALDCNLDGIDDGGFIDDEPSWGIGNLDLLKDLRQRMGSQAILLGDHIWNMWKPLSYVNGYDQESFPIGGPSNHQIWSGAFENSHVFNQNLEYPQFSMFMTRTHDDTISPWQTSPDQVFRLTLASALMLDNYHTGTVISAGNGMADEYKGGDKNQSHWLGKPVESFRRYKANGASLVSYGNFDATTELNKLQLYKKPSSENDIDVTYSISTSEKVSGSGSLHVSVNELPGAIPMWQWGKYATLSLEGIQTVADQAYTLRFKAKGKSSAESITGMPHTKVPYSLRVGIADAQGEGYAQSVIFGEDWHEYNLQFYPNSNGFIDFTFELGMETGEFYIDDLEVLQGASDIFSREFEHGLVLANAGPEEFTFNLKELYPEGSFKRLTYTTSAGNYNSDPQVNNGQQIDSTVTIPAYDGLLLINEGATTATTEYIKQSSGYIFSREFDTYYLSYTNTDVTIDEFCVIDMGGRVILSGEKKANANQITFNMNPFPNGVYTLLVKGDSQLVREKFIYK